jgi:hypothetical protein
MYQAKPFYVHLKSQTEQFQISFISDVHHAADASDENRLIEDLQDRPKGVQCFFMGVGDELDSIPRCDLKRHSPSTMKSKFLANNVYHRCIDAEVEDYAEIINKFTKPEEWLGHITGNHPNAMTQHNTDPTQYLCNLTKSQYLGYSAYVPITIECGGRRTRFMIMAHHGFGGGRTEGASFNAYIAHALRYEEWDLALYGHRHDRWIKSVPRIRPQSHGKQHHPWVQDIETKVAQCGTYLRTLSHVDDGKIPSYAERAGYNPRPLGCLKVRVGLARSKFNGEEHLSARILWSNS